MTRRHNANRLTLWSVLLLGVLAMTLCNGQQTLASDSIAFVSWHEIEGMVQEPTDLPPITEWLQQPIDAQPTINRDPLAAMSACDSAWSWQTLPEGLMWHSYLAAPHEPRISTILFSEHDGGIFWDATLGGRVGLLRYGSTDVKKPEGWQWDLEGAVITRLDMRNSQDVESSDFRFGTELTKAVGPWALKMGYFHISSHVGDEYIERNPTFERINYVTESLIAGLSWHVADWLRLYGEAAYAFSVSGGARQWQFQTGAEYLPTQISQTWGGPFAAINLDVRQAVGYSPSLTAQAGWQIPGSRSDRRIRWGAQYSNGYSSQFEFFQRRDQTIGGGIWFDY